MMGCSIRPMEFRCSSFLQVVARCDPNWNLGTSRRGRDATLKRERVPDVDHQACELVLLNPQRLHRAFWYTMRHPRAATASCCGHAGLALVPGGASGVELHSASDIFSQPQQPSTHEDLSMRPMFDIAYHQRSYFAARLTAA